MTENIQVVCLLDRYWDLATRAYKGTEYNGTLVDISVESSEDGPDVLIPVGIVLLDNNTFQSVPMEFIKKITTN